MLRRNNADVIHCERTKFCFQNKAVYRAEDRPTDICLKMPLPDESKDLKFSIFFFGRPVKTRNTVHLTIRF